LSDAKPISLVAVGDLMLGDSAKCIGLGVRSATVGPGAEYLFREVSTHLRGDIVFGNLECVLSDHDFVGWRFDKAQMRGVSGAARALAGAGITVLNVANNHILQFGAEGFHNTCRAVEAAGIGLIGVRGSAGYCCRPLILPVRGRKVGMLGYCCEKENYFCGETLYAKGCEEEILRDVFRLRDECDAVVVSVHWGHEFIDHPSAQMVEFGRKLVDAGCFAVLGHHPHVVQSMEQYGPAVICYSLGNFVTDMLWDENLRRGTIVTVELSESGSHARSTCTRVNDDYSVAPLSSGKADDLGNISNAGCSYAKRVEFLRKRNRNLSHLYVLRNMLRYHPLMLAQILTRSFISMVGL